MGEGPESGKTREPWALRGINLQVRKGEFVSLVGPNGSGKSTLLQLVAGTTSPSSGRVVNSGRVAAILELGAGFSPEFTGRENVTVSASILGVDRAELVGVLPLVEKFAGIGDYFDRPVKQYSSGMYVRLAFATAIHTNPEILIVDEALAVGDAIFANRCVRKFEELKGSGVTVLFVSHDMGLVKKLSDRAVFLLDGRIADQGLPSAVVNQYTGYVLQNSGHVPLVESDSGHGDGASRIISTELLTCKDVPTKQFQTGTLVTVRVLARFDRTVAQPVFGVLIRTRLGVDVFGTNSRLEGLRIGTVPAGSCLQVDFSFECWLTRQDYTITVATQHWDGFSQDWRDDTIQFSVIDKHEMAGVANLRPSISWRKVEVK